MEPINYAHCLGSESSLRAWDIFCKHIHLYFSMCFANPYGGRLFTLLACRLLLSVEAEFINNPSPPFLLMLFRSHFGRVYKQATFVLFIGSRGQLSIKCSCLHNLLWQAMLRDLLWVISNCYINNSVLDEICDISSRVFFFPCTKVLF